MESPRSEGRPRESLSPLSLNASVERSAVPRRLMKDLALNVEMAKEKSRRDSLERDLLNRQLLMEEAKMEDAFLEMAARRREAWLSVRRKQLEEQAGKTAQEMEDAITARLDAIYANKEASLWNPDSKENIPCGLRRRGSSPGLRGFSPLVNRSPRGSRTHRHHRNRSIPPEALEFCSRRLSASRSRGGSPQRKALQERRGSRTLAESDVLTRSLLDSNKDPNEPPKANAKGKAEHGSGGVSHQEMTVLPKERTATPDNGTPNNDEDDLEDPVRASAATAASVTTSDGGVGDSEAASAAAAAPDPAETIEAQEGSFSPPAVPEDNAVDFSVSSLTSRTDDHSMLSSIERTVRHSVSQSQPPTIQGTSSTGSMALPLRKYHESAAATRREAYLVVARRLLLALDSRSPADVEGKIYTLPPVSPDRDPAEVQGVIRVAYVEPERLLEFSSEAVADALLSTVAALLARGLSQQPNNWSVRLSAYPDSAAAAADCRGLFTADIQPFWRAFTSHVHRLQSSGVVPLAWIVSSIGGMMTSAIVPLDPFPPFTAPTTVEVLENQLFHPQMHLVWAMAGCRPPAAVVEALAWVFGERGCAQDLGRWGATAETATCEPSLVGSLYRAESLAARVINLQAKTASRDYLVRTLRGAVEEVLAHPMELEVDPARLEGRRQRKREKRAEAQVHTLETTCARFISRILASGPNLPPFVRYLCHYLSCHVERKFGRSMATRIVGGLIFLRVICPAIIAPQGHGLTDAPPSAAGLRALLLVAKVIQHISNGSVFGPKEPYMISLNDFVLRMASLVNVFLLECTELDRNPSKMAWNAARYLQPANASMTHESAMVTLLDFFRGTVVERWHDSAELPESVYSLCKENHQISSIVEALALEVA